MMEFLYSKSRKFRSRTFGGSGGSGGKFSHPLNYALARSMEVSELLEKCGLFFARR